jgi:hypothetical protein
MISDVKTLIEHLQKIEDKTKPVYVHIADIESINADITNIDIVDEMSDRVDINI